MSRSGVTDVSHGRDPEVAASGIAQCLMPTKSFPPTPTFLTAGAFVSLASVWPSARFLPSSMLLAGLLNGAIVAFPNKRD